MAAWILIATDDVPSHCSRTKWPARLLAHATELQAVDFRWFAVQSLRLGSWKSIWTRQKPTLLSALQAVACKASE